ncbi:MAG: hypothetical protein LBE08_03735 [Bifidobacteriaceae bacterium]|nr:hypothetical protein [Bifidobacteriaceae bacterium]
MEEIAERVGLGVDEADAALFALTEAGFLSTAFAVDGEQRWRTAVAGMLLAGAEFRALISRAEVEELLAGVLRRAVDYNADRSKPLSVDRIRVFGSYLSDADMLGDLDLAVEHSWRPAWRHPNAAVDYAEASGARFECELDKPEWAEHELGMILTGESRYISITMMSLDGFTDRWETVYQRAPAL